MSDWVIVVDDDESNLRIAGQILSQADIRVTAIKSGRALIQYLRKNTMAPEASRTGTGEGQTGALPDLILLDVKMPDMDGFETMEELRAYDVTRSVPVIFLTADEKEDTEVKALKAGAVDFIKKPFIPEVLKLRVRHMIDLDHLQRNLAYEVDKKTKENESLFLNVVSSLASAIDAKDTYTNGHSDRVARYSREIARRYGYTQPRQEDIFIMGLLHDVGKIGVPDAVINKPSKLDKEEFETIKKHPVLGARILENIKEMPALATGARWHHERFDGRGYPDGLKGTEIPEEARIIAVADSYDAMTSYRSYRDPLPQQKVRDEIEGGMGTQFDPEFARIMLEMIDEDTDFVMREARKDHPQDA